MANAKVTPVAPQEDDLDSKLSNFGIDIKGLETLNVDQMTESNRNNLIEMGGVQSLAKKLCVDIENGLPDYEIKNNFARRREKFGTNKFPEPKSATFLELFLESFKDTTMIILCLAAIASLVTGSIEDPDKGWVEGFAIIFAVLIVAMVTATNNYTKEKQFRALSAKNDEVLIKVLRDGKHDQVPIQEINVGDVCKLEAGDKVPADGVFLRGQDCKSNESSLTGEPDDVSKNSTEDPFLLSGCVIASGNCDIIVIAIGAESRWGRIRSKLVTEHSPTPLMEKLDKMAKFIGYLGTGSSICTMLALLIIYFISDEKQAEQSISSYLIHTLLTGITIIVVAIPEGLPLAVTISLSYSTTKMLKDNNLIRVLSACETMGNVTSICSDKTGTLTENRMTVLEAWLGGKHYDNDGLKKSFNLEKSILNEIAISIACNSSAQLVNKNGVLKVQGNKTEGALLLWINSMNYEYDILRSENFKESRGDRQFPFSSSKKTMSVIVKKPGGGFRCYSKGAAEIILGRCNRIRVNNGTVKPLDACLLEEANAIIIQMAQNALRTVSIAYRDYENDQLPEDLQKLEEAPDSELICDGIFGIMDPLRPDVPDSVAMCRKAGIMVRMVTGDNIHTAKAIAKQCGIFTKDGVALEGPVFRKMTDNELSELIPRLQVLARSSPDDKFKLVNFLKDRREVVGVTGDGTNDAPALKTADVGLAMGISGTDLAKEASDIVIMDDRFSSIKQAVLWGRSVYDNIRKFLQFQLTVNVVALSLTFITAVAGFRPPLNAVMMLWVNLIMDTMGALALGTEPPKQSLLYRRPYKRDAKLVSPLMWRNILCQGMFQIILLMILTFLGADLLDVNEGNYCLEFKLPNPFKTSVSEKNCFTLGGVPCLTGKNKCYNFNTKRPPDDYPIECLDICREYDYTHYTIIFCVFVFCQLFNEFNARSVGNEWNVFTGIIENKIFSFILLATILVQIIIVEIGGDFIKTTPLNIKYWAISFILGSITLPIGFLMRFIPIKDRASDFANPNNIDQQ